MRLGTNIIYNYITLFRKTRVRCTFFRLVRIFEPTNRYNFFQVQTHKPNPTEFSVKKTLDRVTTLPWPPHGVTVLGGSDGVIVLRWRRWWSTESGPGRLWPKNGVRAPVGRGQGRRIRRRIAHERWCEAARFRHLITQGRRREAVRFRGLFADKRRRETAPPLRCKASRRVAYERRCLATGHGF